MDWDGTGSFTASPHFVASGAAGCVRSPRGNPRGARQPGPPVPARDLGGGRRNPPGLTWWRFRWGKESESTDIRREALPFHALKGETNIAVTIPTEILLAVRACGRWWKTPGSVESQKDYVKTDVFNSFLELSTLVGAPSADLLFQPIPLSPGPSPGLHAPHRMFTAGRLFGALPVRARHPGTSYPLFLHLAVRPIGPLGVENGESSALDDGGTRSEGSNRIDSGWSTCRLAQNRSMALLKWRVFGGSKTVQGGFRFLHTFRANCMQLSSCG